MVPLVRNWWLRPSNIEPILAFAPRTFMHFLVLAIIPHPLCATGDRQRRHRTVGTGHRMSFVSSRFTWVISPFVYSSYSYFFGPAYARFESFFPGLFNRSGFFFKGIWMYFTLIHWGSERKILVEFFSTIPNPCVNLEISLFIQRTFSSLCQSVLS